MSEFPSRLREKLTQALERTADLEKQLAQYTENRKVTDCCECGGSIWFREARITDDSGTYHPMCRVAKKLKKTEKQLAAREAQLLQWQRLAKEADLILELNKLGRFGSAEKVKELMNADPPAALRAYVEGLLPEKAKHLGNFDESWGFCDAGDRCNCDGTEAHNACIEQVRENLNKSLEGKSTFVDADKQYEGRHDAAESK